MSREKICIEIQRFNSKKNLLTTKIIIKKIVMKSKKKKLNVLKILMKILSSKNLTKTYGLKY